MAPGDTLVLAGDIFDLFVGAKAVFIEKYAELFAALRAAGERGLRLHYIEGNHDFLIRGAFGAIPGLTVHPEHVAVELGGRRFLVLHGDTVDREDYGYRLLRGFFRSPLMKALVLAFPGEWVDAIGRLSSRRSSGRNPRLLTELPIERRERYRRLYRSFAAERLAEGYDFVIAGHCHDLDEMSFTIGEREGQYINMGYPPVHGSYLSWTEGDEKVRRERFAY